MELARAVVLATPESDDRPWPSVGYGPKLLVPVATKPIVLHALEALREAGVLEVAMVTAAGASAAFRSVAGDGSKLGIRLTYVDGPPGATPADTLRRLRSFVAGESVLVQRADALLRGRMREHVVAFSREGLDALELRVTGDDTGTVAAHLLSASAVEEVAAAPLEPDPIVTVQRAAGGAARRAVEGCLACRNGEASLLEANRLALEGVVSRVEGRLEHSEIQGPVIVHPTAFLRNSLVRGPAIIGPGTRLTDSYVGPYSSIGADVRADGIEIEHSIVMDGAHLLYLGSRLETSIIGRGARISRRFAMPSAVQMCVGDGAQIALS